MKLSRKRISCEIARVKLSPRAISPTHRQKPTQRPFLSPELFRCEMLLHPAQFGRGCLADSLCESYLSVGLNALCSLVLRLFYETFDRHKWSRGKRKREGSTSGTAWEALRSEVCRKQLSLMNFICTSPNACVPMKYRELYNVWLCDHSLLYFIYF